MPRISRHATLLALSFALTTGAGCASTGAVPQPFPRPGASAVRGPSGGPEVSAPASPSNPAIAPAPAAVSGYEIAGTALSLRGSPYRNGGSDPGGFDCSGFIWYVFAQHGIRVPRTVGELYRESRAVDANAVEAGDLLFFNTNNAGASHVGMAIGGDAFVHAPSTRGEVRVEHVSATYWASRFVGARRMR